MKMLIGVIMVLMLIAGAPLVYALTDTEKEAGIASDANGVPCTFGPNHDECLKHTTDYQSGYKTGYADGVAGEYYHHAKTENATSSFSDGYTDGWYKGMVEWGTAHGLKDPQENADLLADLSSP